LNEKFSTVGDFEKQMDILKMKNSITQIKNSMESITID
jgi:hypothetical protein